MDPLSKLLEIGSSALAAAVEPGEVPAWCPRALRSLLERRNGFYAFESALHVLPLGRSADVMTVERWNEPSTWRFEWEGVFEDHLFFAEDVFGNQFSLVGGAVQLVDAESGHVERLADDIVSWAAALVDDYEALTGFPVAHEWQRSRRALRAGERLFPRTPFILGGAFEVENLDAIDAVEAMRARGHLWRQIRDLPPGAEVRLDVT